MKSLLTYIVFLLAFSQLQTLRAQTDSSNTSRHRAFEHNIIAGVNIGATTPLSMPANIRAIESWYPAFGPSLGYELLYHLKKKWGIAAALKMDYKGMTVKDQVMYMHTKITVEDGSSTGTFEGDFTGTNETVVRNAYLTLPLYVVYDFNAKWRVKLGGYAAWLFTSSFTGTVSDGYMRVGNSLGEKITVEKAAFDLSSKQRKWDYGIQLGGERMVGKKIAVMGNFMWGLRPLFSKESTGMDFNMYNLYLTLGVTYRI